MTEQIFDKLKEVVNSKDLNENEQNVRSALYKYLAKIEVEMRRIRKDAKSVIADDLENPGIWLNIGSIGQILVDLERIKI